MNSSDVITYSAAASQSAAAILCTHWRFWHDQSLLITLLSFQESAQSSLRNAL